MAIEDFKIRIVNPSGNDVLGNFTCEAHRDSVAEKAADFVQKNLAIVHHDWAVHKSKANGDQWGAPTTVAELDR